MAKLDSLVTALMRDSAFIVISCYGWLSQVDVLLTPD
jgi:hypothetical protein